MLKKSGKIGLKTIPIVLGISTGGLDYKQQHMKLHSLPHAHV
jgi:hypothetical protein